MEKSAKCALRWSFSNEIARYRICPAPLLRSSRCAPVRLPAAAVRGGRWSPRTVLLCFNFLGGLLREQQKLAAAFFRIAQAPEDQLIVDLPSSLTIIWLCSIGLKRTRTKPIRDCNTLWNERRECICDPYSYSYQTEKLS